MINFLSLLGWNDGSEQEIYTVEELTAKFGLDRITKSAAVFDKVWGDRGRCEGGKYFDLKERKESGGTSRLGTKGAT